ncbi:MAG: hypothetical protein KGI79_00115 [Patescibacteria group bacterium]|nr:hypothetical protein [Patescibacteria group bacterium]MDE2116275.1 hypothetical protein [Patescibacteria group bacterium]
MLLNKRITCAARVAAVRSATAFVAVAMVAATSYAPVMNAAPRAHADSWWQKAVSIGPRYQGDFTSDGFRQSVQDAKASGANAIALIIPYQQTDYYSSDIGPTSNTPSDSDLASAIDYIHGLGLKVIIKPHLDPANSGWRADIQATDRDTWYSKYSAMLDHLGDIGQAHGADEIVIGTELIGMASTYYNSDNTERWVTMINSLRSHYSGLLTYSANFGQYDNSVDEFEQIGFWPNLDYIGLSAYWSLNADSNDSVQSLESSWSQIDQSQIQTISQKYNKPVVFTEVGYRSIDGAHNYPWDPSIGGSYNGQEQANDYQALLQYWSGRSYFDGVTLWDWSSDSNYGWPGNTDYSPQHKPAQDVMSQWFSQIADNSSGSSSGSGSNSGVSDPSSVTGTLSASGPAPTNVQTGQSTPLSVTVTTTGRATNVITDIEVYNSSHSRVFQKFFSGENISQSQPGQYTVDFTPSVDDTYTLKAGVFSSDWSTDYYWNDNIHTFASASASSSGSSSGSSGTISGSVTGGQGSLTTDIWWPTDGANVSGVQPFKAMVENDDVSDYTMYWQVDGDGLNQMSDNSTDWPHKESEVDVSNWTWKGAGPYTVTFIAKDLSGNVISQKSTSIYVPH